MQKLKCARRDEKMPVQKPVLALVLGFPSSDRTIPPRDSSLITRHLSLPQGTWILQKKFFWKNEPKLCPSLLTIVKKRTQNEPK
jgi:hypothetical protein